jgi:hypothetical protein
MREQHNKMCDQSKLKANAGTNNVQLVYWESDCFVKHILCLSNPDFMRVQSCHTIDTYLLLTNSIAYPQDGHSIDFIKPQYPTRSYLSSIMVFGTGIGSHIQCVRYVGSG